MKAAVCRTFGEPLVIEEVTIADPGAREVKVKVAATAICHSDITYADGGWGGGLPAVYGHESAGVVDSVGAGVTAVRPGDHVVVTLIRSCGSCHGCARGLPVTCDATFALDECSPLRDATGAPLVHGLRTAGFAEFVVVHDSQVVRVADDLPLDVASLLACGVITGFGAVTNTARVEAGSHVVEFGTGGVGLNAVQGARVTSGVGVQPRNDRGRGGTRRVHVYGQLRENTSCHGGHTKRLGGARWLVVDAAQKICVCPRSAAASAGAANARTRRK